MSTYFINNSSVSLTDIFLPLSSTGAVQASTGTNFIYYDTTSSTFKDINNLYASYVSGSYAPTTNYISSNYGNNDLNKIFQNISNPILNLTKLQTLSSINFSGNVNGLNFQQQCITCSANGQYISVCGNLGMYYSNNSGQTFTFISFPTTYLFAISMDPSGQYQMMVSSADNTGTASSAVCNIYVSSNYGVTWAITLANVATNNWGRWFQSCCINQYAYTGPYPTGQIMFAGGGGGAGLQDRFSLNYGRTWSPTSGYIYNRPGCTVLNSTTVMCALGSNSGINSISKTNLTTNVETAYQISTTNTITSYRITSDQTGNYIALVSSNSNIICLSSNGGTNWTTVIGPSSSFCNICYDSLAAKLVCGDGSNIYISTNKGTTWTNYSTGYTNIFYFYMNINGRLLYLIDTNNNIYSAQI